MSPQLHQQIGIITVTLYGQRDGSQVLASSSPGHSNVFNATRNSFLHVTLKTWEWPGDEASQVPA